MLVVDHIRYIVYYGLINETDDDFFYALADYKVAILDANPLTPNYVRRLRREGVIVLAYLSVMEDNLYPIVEQG